MSVLVFKDTTVELSTREDCFLMDIAHLTLEVTAKEIVFEKVDLVSRESSPGTWDSDQVIFLPEIFTEFVISIWMETSESQRQLLGFMELSAPDLYGSIGKLYEIPLMCHENYPSLVIKARLMGIDDIQKFISNIDQRVPRQKDAIDRMIDEAYNAHQDLRYQSDAGRLEEVISMYQRIRDIMPDGDRRLYLILNNLALCFQTRFVERGNLSDIDKAIIQLQEVVSLMPDNDPAKPSFLSNLGNSLQDRFQIVGNLADIDNAIAKHHEAIKLTPEHHPDKPRRLNGLGLSLLARFERLGNHVDLEDAITRQEEAVRLIPDSDRAKPSCLVGLGNSLVARFQRLGKLGDIDEAVTRHQEALNLVPEGHVDKLGCLNCLGNSLQFRFERFGNLADIDNAIIRLQEAINLTEDSNAEKPGRLNNLANCFGLRFQRLGHVSDIENAITQHLAAINLTPDNHPEKSGWLNNLVRSLLLHSQYSRDGRHDQAIVSYLSSAAMSPIGSPAVRFAAAEVWMLFALSINPETLLTACECALNLMPLVAWLGLPIADRHQHLVKIGKIAREAAAAAISVGQFDQALEWLEQGRSIVWTQILQLRTPR